MPSTKEIKRRIKSVKSTKKITKAMELVSASKMKRAVSQTLASRLYASYSWDLLTSISGKLEDITHPFFDGNTAPDKSLVVLITSNRGLCGGYNSQIIKKVIAKLKEEISSEKMDIITVGKKGDSAMRRTGQSVVASFLEIPDSNIKLYDIVPLSTMIMNEFKNNTYKNVYVAYTDFVSALTQKPNIRKLLPISRDSVKEVLDSLAPSQDKFSGPRVGSPDTENLSSDSANSSQPYLLEGDIYKLLEMLAEKLVRMQIYQMMLESNASEQSARMVAMKSASDAAGEMIDDLTLVFNKARQAGITREISEISAGMTSVG